MTTGVEEKPIKIMLIRRWLKNDLIKKNVPTINILIKNPNCIVGFKYSSSLRLVSDMDVLNLIVYLIDTNKFYMFENGEPALSIYFQEFCTIIYSYR